MALVASGAAGCLGLLDLRDDYHLATEPDASGALPAGDSSTTEVGDGAQTQNIPDAGDSGDADDADVKVVPPVEPPSCVGLARTCGADGGDSCCASAVVPGGAFRRGEIEAGTEDVIVESGTATVSTFRLDRYLVTVGRFRAFVAAMNAGYYPPAGAGKHTHLSGVNEPGWTDNYGDLPQTTAGWTALLTADDCHDPISLWRAEPGTTEARPMNCVPWRGAYAFCIWDGGFLPTDAEYNYAAVGGDEQRRYPWSRPADAGVIDWTYASYGKENDCLGDPSQNGVPHGCGNADIILPGSKPAGDGRWGHSDLVGTLLEYTADCYEPFPETCHDCNRISSCGTNHSMRGSIYYHSAARSQAAARMAEHPFPLWNGIRCARAP